MKAFEKDGRFSKTAVMLWLAFVLVAFRYLFGGMDVLGMQVPGFDPEAALAFLGTVASLYFANHNVHIGTGTSRVWPEGSLHTQTGAPEDRKPGNATATDRGGE